MSDAMPGELEGEWLGTATLACMAIAERVQPAGFVLLPPGYWSLRVGELELTLEPLTFGRFALAVYGPHGLLLPVKLTVFVQ